MPMRRERIRFRCSPDSWLDVDSTGGIVRNRQAFTIIESTVVVALIAALSAITIPRATTFIDRIEVRGAVTEIESMFSLARQTAIARGSQIALDIDVPRRSLSIRAGTEV